MSTDSLECNSLNAFGLAGQAQPEEQIFVLTSAQLQDLISQATAPLEAQLQAVQNRLDSLEEGVGPGEGGEELQGLRDRLQDMEEATARERAFDRQRIARLERVDPRPLQKDRGEILRALIAANGGKMLAKEARQKMRLSKSSFSQLLVTMKDDLGIKEYHQDKRNLVLFIK